MARIEKTVFISYRRKDISWALAIYQYLRNQNYDVFFDISSLSSGDFEQVIISNIRARAHFLLILTPNALDRCNEPGDWLRREIETAIDEKRNIIPLFFDGFDFGTAGVAERLTGKLAAITRYNGLEIPSGYFMEAMGRLSEKYLNIPLTAVIHPVSTEVSKVVKKEQSAASEALLQRWEEIKDLIKPVEVNAPAVDVRRGRIVSSKRLRQYGLAASILTLLVVSFWGLNAIFSNLPFERYIPPPVSTSDIGNTMSSPTDDMNLVYVPAGEFIMGSDIGDSDEKPAHPVYLDAYWIDRTEVTNAMYSRCVGAGECALPHVVSSASRGNYYGNSEFDDFPVINVDWSMAKAYCEWAERKLPTEAQWEKAARGKDGYTYPWGNDQPSTDLLNFARLQIGDTAKVGSYPDGASPYGALDMAGNVWEWVADGYDETFYSNSPYSNPSRLDWGDYRVLRGGSWWDGDFDVRSSHRMWDFPYSFYRLRGFRCALSADE